MADTVVLPPILDLHAAASLKAELLARRGSPLTLDASGVERLGGLSLQVLLSAAKSWAADGQSLTVSPASEAFVDQCQAFGAGSLTPVLTGATA